MKRQMNQGDTCLIVYLLINWHCLKCVAVVFEISVSFMFHSDLCML